MMVRVDDSPAGRPTQPNAPVPPDDGLVDPVADRRTDLVTLLVATGVLATATAVVAALQTGFAYTHAGAQSDGIAPQRLAANLVAVAVALAALALLRLHVPQRAVRRVGGLLLVGLVSSGSRLGVLVLMDAPPYEAGSRVAELVGGAPAMWLCGVVGLYAVDVQRSLRERGVELVRRTHQAAAALAALAEEELRVRRAVAEGLHGTAQQRLALAVHGLDAVLAAPDDEVAAHWRAAVAAVRDDLDDVRATDVRALSRMLYPTHLDIGVVPAVRALARLVPHTTAVHLEVDPTVEALDDPTHLGTTDGERLLALRVVEEAVTNAVRHSGATSLAVHLSAADGALVVEVQDDGAGFDPQVTDLSGLGRLAERLAIAGGELDVTATRGGGVRVRGVVPLAGGTPDAAEPAGRDGGQASG